jgi:hypothetical protein
MLDIPIFDKDRAFDAAFLSLNDLAYLVWEHDGTKYLYATDLRDTRFWALFTYNSEYLNFDLHTNLFTDRARKYEMLYILERNNAQAVKYWRANVIGSPAIKGAMMMEKTKWTSEAITVLEQRIRDKVARGQNLTCGEHVAWGALKHGKPLTERFMQEVDSMMGFEE